MQAERRIGEYTGKSRGALVLLIGALHGNETSGPEAIQAVLERLQKEALLNPEFEFKGRIVGLIGNLQAYQGGVRFLEQDLNRIWTPEDVEQYTHSNPDNLQAEAREVAELCACIRQELQEYQPEALVVLDLHTTSADGGIFSIPADQSSSLRLAKNLKAPVILGLVEGIQGAFLRYLTEHPFKVNKHPQYTLGVAFESGQHEDPASVSRAIAAILSCLRAAGCMLPDAVQNQHEALLGLYSRQMPDVARLRYVHRIHTGDRFNMRPGYRNFQAIRAQEHLADDRNGPIYAPMDGFILMPLYQKKGSDGFFIVEALE